MKDNDSGRENQSKQAEQRVLVEQGLRIPGVAEALAVYGKVEPYVRPVGQSTVVVRYATGGNPELLGMATVPTMDRTRSIVELAGGFVSGEVQLEALDSLLTDEAEGFASRPDDDLVAQIAGLIDLTLVMAFGGRRVAMR